MARHFLWVNFPARARFRLTSLTGSKSKHQTALFYIEETINWCSKQTGLGASVHDLANTNNVATVFVQSIENA